MTEEIRDEIIIALADLSGSMAGTSVAKLNVQLSELFSELQSAQDTTRNRIRFGILAFHETQEWLLPLQSIRDIGNLPLMEVECGPDRLGRKSDYSGMLFALYHFLDRELAARSRNVAGLYLLLFTDGYPTDPARQLEASVQEIRKCVYISDTRTRCFVIQERPERHVCGNWSMLNNFANARQNLISADDYSALPPRITAELAGTVQMHSVFD